MIHSTRKIHLTWSYDFHSLIKWTCKQKKLVANLPKQDMLKTFFFYFEYKANVETREKKIIIITINQLSIAKLRKT